MHVSLDYPTTRYDLNSSRTDEDTQELAQNITPEHIIYEKWETTIVGYACMMCQWQGTWLVFFSPSSETWVLTMVVSAIRRTQAHARFPLVLSD